jgi:hypothetical protein
MQSTTRPSRTLMVSAKPLKGGGCTSLLPWEMSTSAFGLYRLERYIGRSACFISRRLKTVPKLVSSGEKERFDGVFGLEKSSAHCTSKLEAVHPNDFAAASAASSRFDQDSRQPSRCALSVVDQGVVAREAAEFMRGLKRHLPQPMDAGPGARHHFDECGIPQGDLRKRRRC